MDAEADEDKHLDAQHVIEEAMSQSSLFLTYPVLTCPKQPKHSCAIVQNARNVCISSVVMNGLIVLTRCFSAFIKEMGVSID